MNAKKHILFLLFSLLLSIGSLHPKCVNSKSQLLFNNKEFSIIIQHHIKSVRKSYGKNDTLWIKRNVKIYTHNQGKIDSVEIDLSSLKIDQPNLQFVQQVKPEQNSLEIKRMKFFQRQNKYELLSDVTQGIMGGYTASYIYKRRKGVFKRWVYKRYVGRIWCGEF